jgi:very-short-patch-repair endonuclease
MCTNLPNYSDWDEKNKPLYLDWLYNNQKLSWGEIARKYKTYPNKLIRDAKKYGIGSRSKSDAQSEALKSGISIHPTQGKKRSLEVKIKIGQTMIEKWNNLSEEEKTAYADRAKEQWNNMSDLQKQNFKDASAKAIRQAAEDGSKLEKYIHTELIRAGFQTEFHSERMLANQKLHLDIFLPKLAIAIEVDGISHLEPIWGEKSFLRNQQADMAKNGLLISYGITLIRLQSTKSRLSTVYKVNCVNKILETIDNIQKLSTKHGDCITIKM